MCDCDNVSRYCESATIEPPLYSTAQRLTAKGPQEGEVARLVDEFRFAIDDLNLVASELYARLRVVSQPDYADPCGVPAPEVSDARNELHRLHALSGTLRGILDRLEV